MTTADILRHMIAQSPWVAPDKTVDTVKLGAPDKAVHRVAVCWYPSLSNLRESVRLDCDLLLIHEPTWWDHFDRPGGWRDQGPGLATAEKAKIPTTASPVLNSRLLSPGAAVAKPPSKSPAADTPASV